MPTYEYACEKCGHEFEHFQSIKDGPLEICPKDQCAQKRWGKGCVKRAISGGAGLLFKGSGFYITDYRSDNYKAGAKKESDAKKSGSEKSKSKSTGGKSDTKSSSSSASSSSSGGKD